MKIYPANSLQDYHNAKTLMTEYRDVALGADYFIGGSGLNEELEQFPGVYAPPKGAIILAQVGEHVCGCLALRPFAGDAGEVMRMYVQQSFRGQGIAEALMREIVMRARAAKYKRLYLDSLKRFSAAHRLYEKLGFVYCDFYDPNTTEAMKQNMVFMRLDL